MCILHMLSRASCNLIAKISRGRLAPLHCCIVPVEHISSSRKTDEHVWTEMRNFKKCVLQMYMSEVLPHLMPLLLPKSSPFEALSKDLLRPAYNQLSPASIIF